MAIFGYNTTPVGGAASASAIVCSRFTTTTGGATGNMFAYWQHGGTDNDFRTAIYANTGDASSGRPTGAALATSSSATTVTGTGWFSVPITFTLQATTTYHLCVWSSDVNINIGIDIPGVGTNQSGATLSGTYPTWPTWTDDFQIDRVHGVYVEYTESGATQVICCG